MEFGETFEQAVRREIREEYSCDVLDLKFLGINNVLRKNGDVDTHWITLIFAAQVASEKVRIGEPDKMKELGWFKPDNFPKPQHSMLLEHLEFVKKADVI